MAEYIFPPDLEKTPVRFIINTRQYVPFSQTARAARNAAQSQTGIKTVDILKNKNYYILPIPQQGINDVFNIMYETANLGAVGGAMNTFRELIQDVQADNRIDVVAAGARLGGEFLAQRAIDALAKTVGALPGINSGQAKGGIESFLGVVENPNFAALFKGIKLRNHNFQWKFLPRNLTESRAIGDLVRNLQADALPSRSTVADSLIGFASKEATSRGSNLYLAYPDVAFLKIVGPAYDLITFNLDGCLITDIRASYSDGEVAFFKEKYHPSEVTLSIQFTERTVITRDDFIKRSKGVKGSSPLSDLIDASSDPRNNRNTISGGRF